MCPLALIVHWCSCRNGAASFVFRKLLIIATLLLLTIAIFAVAAGSALSAPVGEQVTGASEKVYTPRAYGARCDGSTDDTKAIQAAITGAIATHGTVQLCSGTALIAPPTPAQVFHLRGGNLRITGCGMGCSVLKLKNGAGDFNTIFGPEAAMSNVTLDNFTVDYNSTNNHPKSLAKFRALVFWATGNNITLDKLDVTDIDAVNVVYAGETHTTVTHSRFALNTGGKYYHDSSVLYLVGEGAIAEGNYFVGAPNAAGSVTAIETHAGGQTITGNVIDGFEVCANLTGINASGDSEGTVFANNVCKNGLIGADLWSRAYGDHKSGKGIHSFSVTGNTFDIHQHLWHINPSSGGALSAPAGISIDSGATLPISNLLIANNNISFDLSSSGSDPYSNSNGAIAYWDQSGRNSVSDIMITGNQVTNSPSAGLYWNAGCDGCNFSGNSFINCGSNLNPKMNSYVRAGITIVTQEPVDIALENEVITDNLATTRMVRGMYLGGAAKSTITVGARINVSGSNSSAYLYPVDVGATSAPFLRITNVAPAMGAKLPPHRVAPSSIIYDIPTGFNYTTKDGRSWEKTSQP